MSDGANLGAGEAKMVEATETRGRVERTIATLIAAAASIAYGTTFGFTYGVNNQVAYMLGAVRLLDPGVLAKDWLAAQTVNYHPVFGYLGWLLLRLAGPSGWGIGIATVVAASVGAMSVYWLATRLLPRAIALPAFLLTLLAMLATGTRELATSYVFDPIFQPSTVASVALIAAMAPFVEGRWLASGILLAVAGLFHANYLVLGVATFAVAHLLLGVRGLPARALRHLGPSVVVFLLLSPIFFKAVGGGDAVRAQQILFDIRSPHHYRPRGFLGDFFPLLAWHTLGLGVAGWIFRRGGERGRRFGAIVLGLIAVVWLGSVLSVVFEVQRVTQLFVWRFAPYIDMLMQLVIAATVARAVLTPSSPLRLSRAQLGVALASIAGLLIALTTRSQPTIDWLTWMIGLGAAGTIFRFARPRLESFLARVPAVVTANAPRLATAAAAILFVATVKAPLESVRARSNLMTGMPGAETDLYSWIRANTERDALFLSPPGLERFRLAGERAIVVDWKSAPYVASEILEWYRRLEDVSGHRDLRTRDDVVAGYDALDRPRLDALRTQYHLDYAVVGRGREGALGEKIVYSNSRWAVLDLR